MIRTGMCLTSPSTGLRRRMSRKWLPRPTGSNVSHSSGQPILFGYAFDGRYIAVVYSEVDEDTIYPITAYEV